MATLAVSSSVSDDTDSDSDSSQCSEASIWDSQGLSRHAECLELEELTAISVNPTLLPALNQLLLEAYAILRPKTLDYDQRNMSERKVFQSGGG